MISEERKDYLLWCWENERVPDDEEWRDDLTAEEQELVDTWDAGYASGLAKLVENQMNIEKAMEILMSDLRSKYGTVMNVRLEHVDEAGYWFSYELPQDGRRQTWCVRHWEVE